MARSTRASLNLLGNLLTLVQTCAIAAATVVSGKNPDATDYVLPVDAGAVTATPIAAAGTDVLGIAAATGLRLLGFSARESAASAAVASFNLKAGATAGGAVLFVGELLADGSVYVTFPDGGIDVATGVWLDRTAGECEVVLYTRRVGI